MAKKNNVTIDKGNAGTWDKYAATGVPTANALAQIFDDAQKYSQAARDWYWKSIATKRNASIIVRAASFVLLICGGLLPVIAALLPDNHRLLATQVGVAALALAGLLQAADRIFGWSTGWLRYITTVTQMESTTRRFALDWGSYILSKGTSLSDSDRKPLFDLASKFADDIAKLQGDETDKWVVEFNSSVAALGDLIKTQRESAEKAVDAAQAALDAHRAEAAARDHNKLTGAIEMTLSHKAAPMPANIKFDNETVEEYLGTVWSKINVTPGHHTVTVSYVRDASPKVTTIADVPAGGIARISVPLQ